MKPYVILVTGATSGFGKAIAIALANQGHIVYGTGRKPQPSNLTIHYLPMDVCNKDSIKTAIDQIISEQQHIDVLINNAGMGIAGAVELATEKEIELQLNTNFMGIVRVCQEVIPHMRQQGGGRIINMSSIGGIFSVPYQGFYCISKHAIEAFTEALALETEQFGITTILVEPGDFNTNFTANRRCCTRTENSTHYNKQFYTVLQGIEKDERNGGTPEQLAKKIVKIVESKHPKFRYLIAKNPLQILSVALYHILPYRVFLWMLRKFYNM